jgi:hypothetical protein
VFHRQLPDLCVQLLDLTLARFLVVPPSTGIKRPRRLLLQLLLPRIDLGRVDPVPLRQIANCRLFS